MRRTSTGAIIALLPLAAMMLTPVFADDSRSSLEHSLLRGSWTVESLQINGDSFGPEMIRDKLIPSGRVEIGDQTIRFESASTGSVRSLAFRLEVSKNPKVIEVIEPNDEVLRGVFKFEDDRLVVCLRRRSDGEVPADFNATAGSHNMLIQLRMVNNTRKPAPSTGEVSPSSAAPIRSASIQAPTSAAPAAAPAATAALGSATDPQVAARELKIRTMLVGTWTHEDPQGTVTTALFNDGTFQSTRRWNDAAGQFLNGRTTSGGKWTYNRGYVNCTVTRSTDPEAVGQVIKNRVHSIGDQSVTYIDLVGRIQHGTRIQ